MSMPTLPRKSKAYINSLGFLVVLTRRSADLINVFLGNRDG
jgi:hypothetical protein